MAVWHILRSEASFTFATWVQSDRSKEMLWIDLVNLISLGPPCSHLLLYYFLQHSGSFRPFQSPRDPMFPLFSDPLPISVFSILRICVCIACFLSYFFYWGILVYNIICFMCTISTFVYNMLTSKKLVSIFHHTVLLTHSSFHTHLFSFLVTATLYSGFTCFL